MLLVSVKNINVVSPQGDRNMQMEVEGREALTDREVTK